MKLKSLFLSMAVLAAFASCSEDENVLNGSKNEPAYAALSFSMSTNISKASGDLTPEGVEVGTDDENGISKVLIVGFNEAGANSFAKLLDRTQLTPSGTGAAVVYKTAKPFTVPEGVQSVYVVVNPSAIVLSPTGLNFVDGAIGKNKTDFEAYVFQEETALSAANCFLMTSADGAVAINPTKAANTEASPFAISVNVERATAKISYQAKEENNVYVPEQKDASFPNAKVTLTDYRLINTLNSEYLLRRVGSSTTANTIGAAQGEAIPTNYVIDPLFDQKTLANAKLDWVSQQYSLYANMKGGQNVITAGVGSYVALPTATVFTKLAYCLENVLAKEGGSLRAFGTGLIFKAVYDLDGDGTPSTFYRYLGRLYASYADLKAAYDLNNVNKLPETEDTADLTAKGIDKYVDGICYYPYWIRHINNNNDALSACMEFAIVRNNVYKLKVDKIRTLGDVNEAIIPEDPIEDVAAKLDVTVVIMPWVIRNNNIIL